MPAGAPSVARHDAARGCCAKTTPAAPVLSRSSSQKLGSKDGPAFWTTAKTVSALLAGRLVFSIGSGPVNRYPLILMLMLLSIDDSARPVLSDLHVFLGV